jgi:5'-phosphate synthase pdxT subunit
MVRNPSAAATSTSVEHPRVGVLALQGDHACHAAAFTALGCRTVRVTRPEDLEGMDALVMPGGESTTMIRLLDANGLRASLVEFVSEKPVFSTCAGVILLGCGGERLPAPPLGILDVDVSRNAYGRQIDSFSAPVKMSFLDAGFHGVFIRAPRISRVGEGVEVIARLHGRGGSEGEIVGVRQGRVVGFTFHPELTSDLRLASWFLGQVAGFALPLPDSLETEVAH